MARSTALALTAATATLPLGLDEDQAINYQGVSGDIDFDDNGDPTSATFEIFHFGDDGYDIREYVEYSYDD